MSYSSGRRDHIECPANPLGWALARYGEAEHPNYPTAAQRPAAQFLTLAGKEGTTALLPIAHRLMGTSLLCTGDIAEARAHHDQGITLYDPVEHRPFTEHD